MNSASSTADTPFQPDTDRRAEDRMHHEPWPEAMRDEFRKVQFLATVDVQEVGAETWHDIFEAFEGRHVRFI